MRGRSTGSRMDGLRALRRFYEDELKPWDMAAGALLVTEAGGSISNLDGSPFDLRWSILAGNKAMHELIGKMIR